jgi:hypothetical protein
LISNELVNYEISYAENVEIEFERLDGSRELIVRDAWALVELYMDETNRVWYFNTEEDAEEFKQMKEEELL